MLFTVYPQGVPPPRQGPNPLLIALFACGGCALVAVIAIVSLGFIAMQAGKGMIKGFQQQKTQSRQFMTDIKAHRFAEAESMLSAEGQRRLPEAALKAMVTKVEKKLGAMQSWDTPEVDTTANRTSNGRRTSTSSPGGAHIETIPVTSGSTTRAARFNYTYNVHFAKGDANAVLAYVSTDIFKPAEQIDRFTLNVVDSGDSDAPAPTDKSRKGSKASSNSDSESNP